MSNTTNLDFSTCYFADMVLSHGIFVIEEMNAKNTTAKPIKYNRFSFPVLLWQMFITVSLVQVVSFILKPFRFPRVVTEIMVGILVGPAIFASFDDFETMRLIYPRYSFINIAMLGEVGMTFFLFLVGVQCNIRIIGRLGKKVFLVAISNLIVPFLSGMLACWWFGLQPENGIHVFTFYSFLSIVPSTTAYPVLARLVTELKFLNTETGRIALYSAIVTDMLGWIIVSITSLIPSHLEATDPTISSRPMKMATLFVVLSTTAFVLVCWFLIRPVLCWYQRKFPEGEPVSEHHLGLVIAAAMAVGPLLDMIGLHATFGGFLIGLMVPKGSIADALVNRLDGFTTSVLLPIFFVTVGSTNMDIMFVTVVTPEDHATVKAVFMIFIIVTLVKLAGNMLVAHLFSMRLLQGLALGLLMCAKGQIELIYLSMGNDKQIYNMGVNTVMVLACLATTVICVPAATLLSNTTQGQIDYRRRNLQSMRPDAELRVVTCIHTIRHVPGILNLLQLSQSFKQAPLYISVLHLTELIDRAVTTITVQDSVGIITDSTGGNEFNRIVSAFQLMDINMDNVSTQSFTVISPYSTMHRDIYKLAESHYMSLIILPFHKMRTVSGAIQDLVPAQEVNMNVLEDPPCSVGILIDQGIGGKLILDNRINNQVQHQVAVLFFGGADDREALTFAQRLAGHPRVTLTLVRFIFDETHVKAPRSLEDTPAGMTVIQEEEMESRFDDRCITEFRLNTVSDETVIYTEINTRSSEDTIHALEVMKDCHDLYIIGRRHDSNSPLLLGLSDWVEFPELGCVGDLLFSSTSGTTASIFILQYQSK